MTSTRDTRPINRLLLAGCCSVPLVAALIVYSVAQLIFGILLFAKDGDADCSEMSHMRTYVVALLGTYVFSLASCDFGVTNVVAGRTGTGTGTGTRGVDDDAGGTKKSRRVIYYTLSILCTLLGCFVLSNPGDCRDTNWFTFVATTFWVNLVVGSVAASSGYLIKYFAHRTTQHEAVLLDDAAVL
jgi:hypothetical protein